MALCRGGMGGPDPGKLRELARLTDWQIVEIVCKRRPEDDAGGDMPARMANHAMPARTSYGSVTGAESPANARVPQTEDEIKAQYFSMMGSLVGSNLAKFTHADIQAAWDAGAEKRKAMAEANKGQGQ